MEGGADRGNMEEKMVQWRSDLQKNLPWRVFQEITTLKWNLIFSHKHVYTHKKSCEGTRKCDVGKKQAESKDLVCVVYNLFQYEHTYCWVPSQTAPHTGSGVLHWLWRLIRVAHYNNRVSNKEAFCNRIRTLWGGKKRKDNEERWFFFVQWWHKVALCAHVTSVYVAALVWQGKKLK